MTRPNVTILRRRLYCVFAALGAVSCAALVMPTAGAAPDDCSGAGLAAEISSVTQATSDYLAAHPDTNQALLDITRQPVFVASGQFDDYFQAHPTEANELRAIQAPALEYQNRCGMQVDPAQAFLVLQGL